jgi:hypothetical protein
MPEGATAPKQIVNLNSSVFRGILNVKYDVIIIHFYAKKLMYIFDRKSLSCELKMYHAVSSMKRVCCSHSNIHVVYFEG